MIFPYSCKAYFNDLEFEDLIDNQNHDIHVIGSWIIPSPYVLFYDIKDILNAYFQVHFVKIHFLTEHNKMHILSGTIS